MFEKLRCELRNSCHLIWESRNKLEPDAVVSGTPTHEESVLPMMADFETMLAFVGSRLNSDWAAYEPSKHSQKSNRERCVFSEDSCRILIDKAKEY